MLPLPVITAMTIAQLDIGHHLGCRRAIPIGAATLTGRLERTDIHFTLNSFVLQPSDSAQMLLTFLDEKLAHGQATIAGYRLSSAVALLGALPDASWSPALRTLAGAGSQSIMDLSAHDPRGEPLTFEQACLHARIPCSAVNPTERFSAWCRSDTDRINHQTQVDAIASWRLVMNRLGAISRPGSRIIAAMNKQLAAWLHTSSTAAARLHAEDIGAIID